MDDQRPEKVRAARTKADKARKKRIAREWSAFRQEHLYSQVKLAQVLGISRRTVQYVEAEDGGPMPSASTLSQFQALKARFATKMDARTEEWRDSLEAAK